MNKIMEKYSIFVFFISIIVTYSVYFRFLVIILFDKGEINDTSVIINLFILLALTIISVGMLFVKNATNRFMFAKYNLFLIAGGALQYFLIFTLYDVWEPYDILEKVIVIIFGLISIYIILGAVSYLISFVFYLRYKEEYTFTEIIENKDVFYSKGFINGSVYFFIGITIIIITFSGAFIGNSEPPMFGVIPLIFNIAYVFIFVYLFKRRRDQLSLYALIISAGFLIYFTYNGFILKEILFSDINNFWFATMMYLMYGFVFVFFWLVTFKFFGGTKAKYNIILYMYSLFTLVHFIAIRFVERGGVIYVQYAFEYFLVVIMTTFTYTFITPLIIEIVKVKTRR